MNALKSHFLLHELFGKYLQLASETVFKYSKLFMKIIKLKRVKKLSLT